MWESVHDAAHGLMKANLIVPNVATWEKMMGNDEVKRVLENYCYTLEDLEYGRIDDEDLENIIDDLW